jgi:GNAT superfamily N-acetyltransferase
VTRRYSHVEELTAAHELSQFDCGSDAQSEWLRDHALQAHRSGTSRVYAVRRLEDDRVVGFHALATGSVLPADAPARVTRGGGRYDVPVIVLTRLGVDRSEQGRGLGRALVVHALRQVLSAAAIVGVRALLIHAEDETARSFYDRLAEFEQSPTDDLHLYLLLKDIRRTLA